jgi:hypothetical protein
MFRTNSLSITFSAPGDDILYKTSTERPTRKYQQHMLLHSSPNLFHRDDFAFTHFLLHLRVNVDGEYVKVRGKSESTALHLVVSDDLAR